MGRTYYAALGILLVTAGLFLSFQDSPPSQDETAIKSASNRYVEALIN